MKERIGAYELAKKIGCSNVTIYGWVKKGLPYTTVRQGLKEVKQFDYKEVLKWIKEQKEK